MKTNKARRPGYLRCYLGREALLMDRTKLVLSIAWPSIVELMLVSLCAMVDSMMVGRLSPYGIAAVGLTNQPRFILQAIFVAMNVGSTALVARFRGANDRVSANIVLRQSLLLTAAISVILSVIGFLSAESLVRFMGAESEQVLAWSTDYLRVTMCYFPFMALSLAITAALRGVGNTRASMYMNLGANIVNVIFNYCLIYGNFFFPKLEVFGAALATGIGQLFAFSAGLFVLMHRSKFISLGKDSGRFRPDFSMIRRMMHIGVPSMFEQVCMRVGMMVFTLAITSLGELVFAAHNITMSIMDLSFMNGTAFGIAATTLVGQNMGRGDPDAASEFVSISQHMAQVLSVVIALVFFFLGQHIIWIFMSDGNPEEALFIVSTGAAVLRVVAFLQPFQTSQMVITGALRGVGDTRFTALIYFIGLMLIRPILAVLAVRVLHWGLLGAYMAMFGDQVLRCVLVQIRFNNGKWKEVRV